MFQVKETGHRELPVMKKSRIYGLAISRWVPETSSDEYIGATDNPSRRLSGGPWQDGGVPSTMELALTATVTSLLGCEILQGAPAS